MSRTTDTKPAKAKRRRCTFDGCRRLGVIDGRCSDHPKDPTQPGRPVGYTLMDTKGAELLEAIRKGRRPATARILVGLGRSTVQRWLSAGESAELLHRHGTELTAEEETYRDFLAQYQRACVDMQARLEARLSDMVDTMEPREALEVLARMDREVWGRHDTVTVRAGGDDTDVLRRWAETLGHVIRQVLDAAHLTEQQQVRAQEALDKALAQVSVDDDEDGTGVPLPV